MDHSRQNEYNFALKRLEGVEIEESKYSVADFTYLLPDWPRKC